MVFVKDHYLRIFKGAWIPTFLVSTGLAWRIRFHVWLQMIYWHIYQHEAINGMSEGASSNCFVESETICFYFGGAFRKTKSITAWYDGVCGVSFL